VVGAPATKVIVEKAVYTNGTLQSRGSISANNRYSLKVDGAIHNRSILDLRPATRYIIDWGAIEQEVRFGHTFCMGADGPRFAGDGSFVPASAYDAIISTIPLPAMLDVFGIDVGPIFTSRPIYIVRFQLTIESSVHQTIYFPDDNTCIYRATMESGTLILESVARFPDVNEIAEACDCFGLNSSHTHHITMHTQGAGKIKCFDDDLRRMAIMRLSDEHNIFSVGRFATWRQIRVDDLIRDLERVSKLIRSAHTRRKYASRIDQ
jgi:hypothetical protein